MKFSKLAVVVCMTGGFVFLFSCASHHEHDDVVCKKAGVSSPAPNLVKNPGFEELDANGRPVGWDAPPEVYSVDKTTVKSGKVSLHYKNNSKDLYRLCTQNIPVDLKKSYQFGLTVKAKGMIGDGPTVCLEFYDEFDKYLGGQYPPGINCADSDWTEVKSLVRKFPEKVARVQLTVYCREVSIGDAWFDDAYVTEFIPPMLGVMTTDQYRNQTDGTGTINLYADYYISGRKDGDPIPSGTFLNIKGPDGRNVLKLPPVDADHRVLHFSVDAAKLPVGESLFTVNAVNPLNLKKESASIKVTRVKAFPKRKSYIDNHRRLIVDGKPFFPLGMYFGSAPAKEVEIYRQSAFNCIMPYSQIKREELDNLHASGISVIYSVKDLYMGHWGITSKQEADERTRKSVAAVKDHPAIIAWYINDEFPLGRLPELIAKRDLMEQLDPGRPTWVVLYQIDDIREYLYSFDVIGTDPYPIPNRTPDLALEYARRTFNACFGCRAVWMVPQVFNWAAYWKNQILKNENEVLASRAPTFQEMKSMSWMCLSGGANGLIFYSWFDLLRMGKLVKDGGRALRVDPFEQRWAEVKRMAAEIAEFQDVLLSIDEPIRLTPVNVASSIGVRAYAKGGETWLLVVNSDNAKSMDAAFRTPFEVVCTGTKLGESPVSVNGKNLTVNLKPLEALFIRLKRK